MQRDLRKILATALIALAINLSPLGASSSTASSGISISGLSEFTLKPTSFTVSVSDSAKEICAMRYAGLTRNATPWVFRASPHLASSSDLQQFVRIEFCDGSLERKSLDTKFAWTLSQNIIFLDTLLASKKVDIALRSSVNEIGNVSITDSNGKVLVSAEIAPQDFSKVSFRVGARSLGSKYFVSVTGEDSGMTSTMPIHVANKWKARTGANTYERCSTVAWSYSHRGAPKLASKKAVLSDIRGAFERISPHVGLDFKEVKSGQFGPGTSHITLDWDYSYSPTAAGAGGSHFQNGRTVGYVHLNPKDWWPRDDKYRGFASANGVVGRGWLFVHEVMHALGMSHTVQEDQIMSPLIGQAKLGSGDIEGLRFLYQPKSCR